MRNATLRTNALLALVFLMISGIAWSAELRDLMVEREDNHYELNSETWFDVSPESLYDVLSNYDLFTKFTSAIVESRNVEPDEEGRPRFYSRMEGCVMFWCKSFIRNGYLLLEANSEIVAISHPDESDFTLSRERWHLVPEGEGTLMIYEFEMEPDFWVPPVIGPFFIMRALRAGAERAIDRIEALAVAESIAQ